MMPTLDRLRFLDRLPALDELPLWAACVPLAIYLLLLGVVHLRRRPLALSGAWDQSLLAFGVAGFVAAGPLAVVQPAIGTTPWSALLLVALFALFVAMGTLVARPRLVIYNITMDQLRPVVADVVSGLDPAARWAGGTAALPSRRMEVRLDGHGATRTVSVVAGGERPAAEEWGEFCARLRRGLSALQVRTSPWAGGFLVIGGTILAVAGWLAWLSWSSPVAPPPGAAPDASSRRPDAS